jgi:hypothetical protein
VIDESRQLAKIETVQRRPGASCRSRATPFSTVVSAATPRTARYSASVVASSDTMTREKCRATSPAHRSRSTPLVSRCNRVPFARNILAASNTSGRSSGSPPENRTRRVPNAGNASATSSISSSERSPAPLHFHQSQDTQRLLQRLVG